MSASNFKNILVTGGAGFIGANFILHLLKKYQTIKVVNLDKLTYAANLSNLDPVKNDSRYCFVQGDICDTKLVLALLTKHRIDTLIHFAAESHVDRSIADASQFIQTNINGTHSLLEACKAYTKTSPFYRFHHISTDEVYGSLSADDPAFTENSPYQPNSPYAASKASSDHLVRAYFKTHGLPTTISNCSNNYGRFQHKEKLIPKVINACIHQLEIPIYGNGKNIRDWLHVDDHCHAIDLILQQPQTGETFNIGGDNEMQNIDLVTMICELCDKQLSHDKSCKELITFVKDRAGHDWRYSVDASKVKQHLHWTATATNTISAHLSQLIKEHTLQMEKEHEQRNS